MSSRNIAQGLAFLTSVQNADGGWPYLPGPPSVPEATCHALLACALSGEASATRAGLAWITRNLGADGALYAPGHPVPHWSTSLALYALARLGNHKAEVDRLAGRLLAWKVQRSDTDVLVRLNAHLAGWSWNEGTFSWVEPTAYAVLALKQAGQGNHPRVWEGVTLLVDRACAEGGWNYGNPEVMGRALPAFPDPTAWALLALQGRPVPAGVIQRGLDFLEREVPAYPSALALALGCLALSAWDRAADTLTAALRARQGRDGSWRQRVAVTALAVLALMATTGGPHAFRL